MSERHVPVLLEASIDLLRVRPGGTYVDCTLGLGGHAEAMIRKLGPSGQFFGFDRDPEAMALVQARLDLVRQELERRAPRITFVGEAFS